MLQKLTNFIFEGLHLKQIKHEWWRMAWIPNPDSVAEHSLCAAQIWYILAKMEWANAEKVASMLVWHDFWEARVGDSHKIAMRYINGRNLSEKKAFTEATQNINFWKDILDLFNQYEERTSLEGQIAKDADYLEQAFMAKYYVEIWYKNAEDWIRRIGDHIQTKSAKNLWKTMNETWFTDWWKTTNLKETANK